MLSGGDSSASVVFRASEDEDAVDIIGPIRQAVEVNSSLQPAKQRTAICILLDLLLCLEC